MRADKIEYTVYVVQAYSSMGRATQPYWYDIADWALQAADKESSAMVPV